MKANEKSLQKFTETDKKISMLLEKKKITQNDIDTLLNYEERRSLEKVLIQKINESKGDELEKLLKQIDEILPTDTKNQLWENNHLLITVSMSKFIDEHGKMPTKSQIATDTGLSRQTVYKHLNGFAEHPLYSEQLKQFKFMADRVLAKVIKLAGQGDVKAARLYFDVMGNLISHTSNDTLIKNQNNYIQINGTILSQETIKQLSSEQLNTFETILKTFLLRPEIIGKL